MPELKNFDPAIAVQAVEKARDDAHDRVEEATARAFSLLKDAQDGIPALQQGAGPLLERAQYVYVATFATGHPGGNDFICDPSLHFDSSQYRVRLDEWSRFQSMPRELWPKLDLGRRYRAIVILEPVD